VAYYSVCIERVFTCGFYVPEDLQFSMLLLNEYTLDCVLVFVVVELDFKSQTFLAPFRHLLGCQILVIKWSGYGIFH
jgi:hypothetical protein